MLISQEASGVMVFVASSYVRMNMFFTAIEHGESSGEKYHYQIQIQNLYDYGCHWRQHKFLLENYQDHTCIHFAIPVSMYMCSVLLHMVRVDKIDVQCPFTHG